MTKPYVICPATITSPAPDYGLPANVPCGCEVPIEHPAEAMDCRCPRGHRFIATTEDIHEPETPEFRWGDVKQCPSCESTDIERQTANEGRPFSCNNCGLEFFKDADRA